MVGLDYRGGSRYLEGQQAEAEAGWKAGAMCNFSQQASDANWKEASPSFKAK